MAWRGWRVMSGFGGVMGDVCVCRGRRGGAKPCSCCLARSGLGEDRQLTSLPSVLLRPAVGASVIVGHLESRGGLLTPPPAPSLTPELRVTQLPPSSPFKMERVAVYAAAEIQQLSISRKVGDSPTAELPTRVCALYMQTSQRLDFLFSEHNLHRSRRKVTFCLLLTNQG